MAKAGAKPRPDRLLETGQGMAATLRIASERRAYTLTDRATFTQLAHALALRIAQPMEIRVDRESGVPLFRQIHRQIRDLILSGELPEGLRLPPERQLARSLGVNRALDVALGTAVKQQLADDLRATVVEAQAQ